MNTWLPACLSRCSRATQGTTSLLRPSRFNCSARKFTTTQRIEASNILQTTHQPRRDVFDAPISQSSEDLPPIQSAAEILFAQNGIQGTAAEQEAEGLVGLPQITARIVPISPSYFTGSPIFYDNFLQLRTILRKYATVPTVKPGEQPRVSWRNVVEFRNMCGENVPNAKYAKVLAILQRLNQIDPALMPAEVRSTLEPYKKAIDPTVTGAVPIPIDRFGRALGVGRRKSSTARAWVVEGTGEVLINGKSLTQAFARIHDRESVLWALKSTDRIDKYNVWALVDGGGSTGQAEALTMAVAKGLLTHEPSLKPALRRAGVVTRDPRRVERKKAGRVKARKMPQWVKR